MLVGYLENEFLIKNILHHLGCLLHLMSYTFCPISNIT